MALASIVVLASSPVLAGSAPPAAPAVMGYGEFGYGYAGNDDHWLYDTDNLDHAYAVDAAGAINLPLTSMMNFEAEARLYDVHNGPDGDLSSFVAGYGHLFGRSSSGAAGVFGGYGSIDNGNYQAFGAEVLGTWGNFDLLGQVAYFGFRSPYYNPDGWFVRGAARLFLTPDTRLEGDAQWNEIHTDGLGYKSLTVIGTVEHRLAAMPLSVFGSVRWDWIDTDYGDPGDEITGLIGIRAYFGGPTLLDNDRGGAPFDVIPVRLAEVTR